VVATSAPTPRPVTVTTADIERELVAAEQT
jgi:hypothetical protein